MLAIIAAISACAAWAFFAFVYAAWAHIEGLRDSSEIFAAVIVAACGIAGILLGLRAGLAGRRGSAWVALLASLAAFAAWMGLAPL
jgi:hypothetical protein